MKWRILESWLIVTSLTATNIHAQSPKVVLVGVPLGVAVDRSLGLTPGTTPTTDNAALLNASIANSGQLYAIYFPGKVWAFGTTVVSTNTGRNFVGNGIDRLDGGDSWSINNGTPSKIAPTLTATTFNGSTVTASATGATATIVPSGITVAADDLLHTVTITGGTNFIVGKYHINSVNAGAGTWTLDRVCTTGNASGMLGSRQRTVWRDEGFGNCFEGLNFRGHPTAYTDTEHADRAAIGWHQRTFVDGVTPNTGKTVMNKCTFTDLDVGIMFGKGLAQFPSMNYIANGTLDGSGSSVPAWTLAGGALRGGAAPESLVFTTSGAGTLTQNTGCTSSSTYLLTYTVTAVSGGTVTPSLGGTSGTARSTAGTFTEDIVCGSGTNQPLVFTFGGGAGAYITVDNISLYSTNLAAVQDYDGKADNNADTFRGSNLHFQACDNAIVLRNSQAVAMQFDNINTHHRVDTVFYVERGGKLTARGVWMTSGFPAKGPTLLRIGGAGSALMPPVAASPGSPIVIESVVFDAPGENLKLLEMDGLGNSNGDVTFRDVVINANNVGTSFTMDGTVKTATAGASSATITLTGSSSYTVVAGDVANLVTITGGTNFIPGTYSVNSVSTGSNTWTLDRVCTTSAGGGTGMTGSSTMGFYKRPLVNAKDGWHVTLDGVGPITPGSIRLDDAASLFKPSITLRNCILQIGDSEYLTPDVVIDKDGSTFGCEVRFEGCTTQNVRRKFCRDGVFVCDGAGAGVWRQGWVDPVP